MAVSAKRIPQYIKDLKDSKIKPNNLESISEQHAIDENVNYTNS
jgi:hypothetical protein